MRKQPLWLQCFSWNSGCQTSLTPFLIALFYSTLLFVVVSFHSPVDVSWSWTRGPMLKHALQRTFNTFLLLKNILGCDETSNYLLPSEKSVTPRSDDYPPESLSSTVLKCFSKSNPEISAWDEVCKQINTVTSSLKETAAPSECCFHTQPLLRI